MKNEDNRTGTKTHNGKALCTNKGIKTELRSLNWPNSYPANMYFLDENRDSFLPYSTLTTLLQISPEASHPIASP